MKRDEIRERANKAPGNRSNMEVWTDGWSPHECFPWIVLLLVHPATREIKSWCAAFIDLHVMHTYVKFSCSLSACNII
jgi:hypothetical protein